MSLGGEEEKRYQMQGFNETKACVFCASCISTMFFDEIKPGFKRGYVSITHPEAIYSQTL